MMHPILTFLPVPSSKEAVKKLDESRRELRGLSGEEGAIG